MNESGGSRQPVLSAPPGQILAWAAVLGVLAAMLRLHLLPALLAGLSVYAGVQSLTRVLRFSNLRRRRAKLLAVGLLTTAVTTALIAAGLGLVTFLRHGTYSLPTLMQRLADIIERSRDALPAWLLAYLPDDPERLRQALVAWLRRHTETLSTAGRSLGKGTAHVLIGMVIGALLSLREPETGATPRGPLTRAIAHQASRLEHAFRRVVFAQLWIATLNTALTAVYFYALLPACGIHLPLTKTLLVLTFIVGLLPILGNLVSNSAIVVVSLGQSLWLAAISLAYLVAIHKLEYFLNARIVGGRISARAWELLIAMVTMEAIFGLAGLIAAPIFYAYAKGELIESGWA
ncbi:MAG: AI-2E family transporter [Gammaproteobacteria bacterium]|nr:AI-2E family transporter [Gammaproteobacteria bacterium]